MSHGRGPREMYSRTRCQVQASQRKRFRLGAEVSSGPLFASAAGRRLELSSNLLSDVLMKDSAHSFQALPPPDWLNMKISNAPAVKREAEKNRAKREEKTIIY